MNAESAQTWVFDWLKAHYPSEKLLADLEAVLQRSRVNIYKRMNGSARLSADELVALIQHFDVPIYEYPGLKDQKKDLQFSRPSYAAGFESLMAYLDETTGQLRQLSLTGHRLYYAARDIPLFYYFYGDNLIRLKHLVWLRDTNYEAFKNYKMRDIPLKLVRASRDLFNLYQDLETREFWTLHTASNLLAQIWRFYSLNLLSPQEADLVLRELKELFIWRSENLSDKGKQQLYLVDFLNMANHAFFESDQRGVTFLSTTGINYITTSSKTIAEDMKKWFKEHERMGVKLSANYPSRDQFFQTLSNQVEDLQSEVKALSLRRR